MIKKKWVEDFKKVYEENEGFGCNSFSFDDDGKEALNYLKGIDKRGGEIEIIDYENIKVKLPKDSEELLLYIISTPPTPTDVDYNKKKRTLELTWS